MEDNGRHRKVRLYSSGRSHGRPAQGPESVKTLEDKWPNRSSGQSRELAENGQQGPACEASRGSGPGLLPSLFPHLLQTGRVRVSG